MNNNQILKALKKAHSFTPEEIQIIWKLGGIILSRDLAVNYFKGESYRKFRPCSEEELQAFLTGYIRFFEIKRNTEEGDK